MRSGSGEPIARGLGSSERVLGLGLAAVVMTLVLRVVTGSRDRATGWLLLATWVLLALLAGQLAGRRLARFPALGPNVRLLAATMALAVPAYFRTRWGNLDAAAGFLFLSAASLGGLGLTEGALTVLGTRREARVNVRVLAVTTCLFLFAVEAVLRFGLGRYATYLEANGGSYQSLFEVWHRNSLHVYHPNGIVRYEKTEFTHERATNALGIPDAEFVAARAPDEYRVLALGDSFTEGVGTPVDSTWVRVAQRALAEAWPGRRITALNAGVSGSDPCFEYVLLEAKLLPLRPDLVVVVINTSDVGDLMVRGGMERFRADGTLAFREPPGWERLYGLSHTFRAVVHEGLGYNRFLIRRVRERAEEQRATGGIREAISVLARLCQERDMDLMVVSHPFAREVREGRYAHESYGDLLRDLAVDRRLHFFDLMAHYAERRLITRDNLTDFYWKVDLHHTTRGYQVMGRAIAGRIAETFLED